MPKSFMWLIIFILIIVAGIIIFFYWTDYSYKQNIARCQTRNVIMNNKLYPVKDSLGGKLLRLRVKEWGTITKNATTKPLGKRYTHCMAQTGSASKNDSLPVTQTILVLEINEKENWRTIQEISVDVRSSISIDGDNSYNFEKIVEELAQEITINNDTQAIQVPTMSKDYKSSAKPNYHLSGYKINVSSEASGKSFIELQTNDEGQTWQIRTH